jgi:hypothetical protein
MVVSHELLRRLWLVDNTPCEKYPTLYITLFKGKYVNGGRALIGNHRLRIRGGGGGGAQKFFFYNFVCVVMF